MLLALLLCTAWASQAQSLTVKVNDGTALTGQGSLQAAIEASNVQLAGITSIEISAGTFNTNDWEYLKNNKTELSSLASFTITNGITSVADMPVAYTSIFNKSLTSVSVDASFAVVGMPFSGCTALTTVNLPAATSIGSYVFSGCTALTSISLPVVTSVGEAAFSGCSALATVNLPVAINIGAEAFQNCSKLTEVNLPVATSIDNYAFSNCIALSAISLPAATRIGQAAFNKCVELATVNLPVAASISYQAFSGCIKLGSISLPNTTNIEGSAFAGCAALATISLPVATSIGDYVFYNCDALSTLELRAAPPTMGSNVFGNSSSPRYLKLVAADGTPLTNNDLTEAIDAYKAHDGWDAHASTWHGWSLMHVVAATPSSAEGGAITGAGQYKPGETATLTAVPNKGYLFKQWSNGQTANPYSFEVGADVELEAQFELDHTVYPLTVKVNTTTLTDQVSLGAAVMGCGIALKDITSIEISAGTFTHNDWQFLADIRDYLNSLESFSITNGIVRVADMPNLQDGQSYFNESLTTLSIDARLTVGNFAFNNCKNLSSISLPKATSIGGNAFSGCEALIAVDLPAATEISWMAFSMCENLTMVNLPEATSIGRDAFSFCKALTSVNLPKASSIGDGAFIFCDGLSSVSLPAATSIYFGAFRSCYGLTLMELGATPPTNVGSDVFQDCPSPRYLKLVDAEGNPLTGTALTEAVDAYKAATDGNTSDNLWYGWNINGQPNESLTVKVNGGAEITGSSLQAIFEANNIEPASVTQLELLSGNLQGYDAAYMRTSLTALKKLTLTTATELNLRLQHSSLQEVYAPELEIVGGGAFYECTALTTVSLPKATEIGDGAFRFCFALTTVSLPAAKVIDVNAFSYSTALTFLELGGALPTVGSYAFDGCPSPRYLKLVDDEGNPLTGDGLSNAVAAYKNDDDGDTEDNLWYGWRINEQPPVQQIAIKVNGGTEITGSSLQAIFEANNIEPANVTQLEVLSSSLLGYDAGYIRSSLTALQKLTLTTATELNLRLEHGSLQEVSAPQLQTIGEGVFGGCEALTTVSLPAATEIGEWAFERCSSLISVNLPKATSIGVGAFGECSSLTTVSLPEATEIGEWAFGECSSLTSVNLPAATSIGDAAFDQCSSLTSVNLPKATEIGYGAFAQCSSLTSVNLPAATSIGMRAFAECFSLISVNLPKAVNIGEGAFEQCQSLTTVNMPEAINIGSDAFFNCESLTTMRIPKAESIDKWSFEGCYNLTFLELGATPPNVLDPQTFDDCASPRYLTVDVSAVDVYRAVKDGNDTDGLWYGWRINEQPLVQQIAIKVNGGAEINGSSLQAIIEASNIEPASVTQLEVLSGDLLVVDVAYMRCSLTALQKLTLTTTTDLNIRLQHSSLQEVYAPKLEIVGEGVFSGCYSLTSVNLPEATSIGDGAFYGCSALTSASLPAATSIGISAFYGCSALTTVSLPKITSIRNEAFGECPALFTLELGATPPNVVGSWNLGDSPDPRSLTLVDADGNPLSGDELTDAIELYRSDAAGYLHGVWRGWSLEPLNTLIYTASEGGIIVGRAVQRLYYEQDGTTVIAVPADGYKFLRWSDDCTDNPRTDHEVRADLSVQALFEHLPYNLTYTAGVGGHIDGQLSQSVKQGENASTVKAIPADGYKFLRWSDGRTDNPRTDTNVQADLSVEAVFIDASTIVYTLTYTASDGGSIKGTATQTVVEGESGTEVEAIANEGYRFVRWSDGLTTAKRIDTNVQKNISVTAEFVQESSNEGGDNGGGDSTGLLNISRESLSAYPNPTTGELWVSVPEPVEGTAANVLLYNVAGQLLQRVPAHGASAGSAASRLSIDLSAYPAGMYIIQVGNAVAKVLKQ